MSWPMVKLGDVVDVKGGGTPSKSNPEYWGGDIPWASVKDFKSNVLNGTEDYITKLGVEQSATNVIPAGNVIVPTRMALGKVAINQVDMAINQDLKALMVGDEKALSKQYLLRFIESKASFIEKQGKGATVKGITLDVLRNLEVPLPPLTEQKRIAAILDKADAIRRKRQQAIQLADEFLRSVFLDMFGDPEGQGWKFTTVESMAAEYKGSMRTGPFGSDLKHSEFISEGISILGIDNVVTNKFSWGKGRFISQEKYEQLKRYTVKPGDVLITIMGTCGRCAVVPDDVPLVINTKHLFCITLDKARCLPSFLHSYFLVHPIAKRYLIQATKGAIMDGLNMGIIKDMPIPLVPVREQEKYQAISKGLQKLIESQRESSGLTEKSFLSLSQKLFSSVI